MNVLKVFPSYFLHSLFSFATRPGNSRAIPRRYPRSSSIRKALSFPTPKSLLLLKRQVSQQEATTDDKGVYSVTRLAPGLYKVTAEKAGFKIKVLDDVQLTPEQTNSLNINLEVGAIRNPWWSTAPDLPAIDTESGTISGNISSKQIQALPSFGRDVYQLTQLAPGAFSDGAQQGGGGTNQLPGTNSGASGSSDGIFKRKTLLGNCQRPQPNANNITLDGVGITAFLGEPR